MGFARANRFSRASYGFNPESGMALVLVLLLVALFSAMVGGLIYQARIEASLLNNFRDRVQVRAVAKAGIVAAKGLILHSSPFDPNYRDNFQNQFIQLFQCTCYSAGIPALSGTEGLEEGSTAEELTIRGECGQWKMVIDYPVGEHTLHLEITDEESKLNLNALVKRSLNPNEDGARENPFFRYILFELFRLRAYELGLQYSDDELNKILNIIRDWLDYGQMAGSFDSDEETSFQDGDIIYSNRNGPMETLSELKMIPGITDEFYYGLKDFLTVYPINTEGTDFSPKVNLDLASEAVVYALVKGSSYAEEKPMLGEDEVVQFTKEIIQSAQGAGSTLSSRKVPQALVQKLNTTTFLVSTKVPRVHFYHISSTGMSQSGVYYTIEAVLQSKPGAKQIKVIYWREG